jgi:dethiobiotin synthase
MNDRLAGFFVTGTDTGIGKTYISRLLVDSFAELGPTTYCKPVQTGCTEDRYGALRAPDFDDLCQGRMSRTADYETHVPYRFKPACSPHLAAEMADVTISIDHIVQCVQKISSGSFCTIVEGSGGVYVPLGGGRSMLDLMAACKLPVILVTAPRLGTINHTLLSLMALKNYGLTLAGVVINNYEGAEKDFVSRDNRKSIALAVAPVPVLDAEYNQKPGPAAMEFCHELNKRFA